MQYSIHLIQLVCCPKVNGLQEDDQKNKNQQHKDFHQGSNEHLGYEVEKKRENEIKNIRNQTKQYSFLYITMAVNRKLKLGKTART